MHGERRLRARERERERECVATLLPFLSLVSHATPHVEAREGQGAEWVRWSRRRCAGERRARKERMDGWMNGGRERTRRVSHSSLCLPLFTSRTPTPCTPSRWPPPGALERVPGPPLVGERGAMRVRAGSRARFPPRGSARFSPLALRHPLFASHAAPTPHAPHPGRTHLTRPLSHTPQQAPGPRRPGRPPRGRALSALCSHADAPLHASRRRGRRDQPGPQAGRPDDEPDAGKRGERERERERAEACRSGGEARG